MYLWCLLPSLATAGSGCQGTSLDLASAMRLTEPALTSDLAFMIAIKELVPRISVDGLVTCWVPTGREWHARRDRNNQPVWTAKPVPVDPDCAYILSPDADLAAALAAAEGDAETDPAVEPAPPEPHADTPR